MKESSLKLALAGALALGMAAPAMAQDAPDKRISGTVGVDLSSHFISYGFDVWGDGSSWSRPSFFVWTEVNVDFDFMTLTAGAWSDVNNKEDATDPIGGKIQEIDVYVGVGFEFDRFSFGVTFQEWYYGITEGILDFAVGYDDSDLLMEGFAFNPSIVWHNRIYGEGLDRGAALVFGIEPSFVVVESADYPVTLSIPVAVALNMTSIRGDNDLYDGSTGDFAYASVGATVGVPLSFIPSQYGDWEAAANLTYYMTSSSRIGNPRDNFLTGMLSVAVSF
jgi:hypothetical protein